MKDIMRLLLTSIFAIGVFLGCSGDAKTSTPEVVTTSGTLEINTSVTDTPIAIGDSGAGIEIATGTSFTDENGTIVAPPKIEAEVKKSSTETSTTIDFGGVMPTEPMTLSVPAPSNSKEGDEVLIDAPDGSQASKKIRVTVIKRLGKLIVRILIPKIAFIKRFTLVVRIETDDSTN